MPSVKCREDGRFYTNTTALSIHPPPFMTFNNNKRDIYTHPHPLFTPMNFRSHSFTWFNVWNPVCFAQRHDLKYAKIQICRKNLHSDHVNILDLRQSLAETHHCSSPEKLHPRVMHGGGSIMLRGVSLTNCLLTQAFGGGFHPLGIYLSICFNKVLNVDLLDVRSLADTFPELCPELVFAIVLIFMMLFVSLTISRAYQE